jgi:glycosyltransferase involved in cell wall biosynthesis
VLCVSAKNPHKNLGRLIEAFAALGASGAVLVIAGAPSPHEQELHRRAAQLGVEDRVRILDWVSEADLEGLYALARCVAYPSLMEGFGLPVLEAMRRRVPVACASTSAVGEVADGAAELFDPVDVDSIRRALDRVLSDDTRRRELIERGLGRAAGFTWEATARATLESYRRAIDGVRGR